MMASCKCGARWRQRGNRTGHCSACHQTFEGLAVFDSHQRESAEGKTVCLPPDRIWFKGKRLRLVDGTWRGPAMVTVPFPKGERA